MAFRRRAVTLPIMSKSIPMINLDPTDNLVGISVAGTNNRFNSITIDGVAQNDDFGLNANGQPGQRNTISMDVVEQIAINIAPFDVQYNGFQGANFNVVTKSGTNEFHGSAYGFLRNQGLSGSSSTNSDGERDDNLISDFSETTWGATLGGPIIKDKLFFFAGYEQFSSSTPLTTGPAGSRLWSDRRWCNTGRPRSCSGYCPECLWF